MLRDMLNLEGLKVGRRHVRTLMRKMGIDALYQKPRTVELHLKLTRGLHLKLTHPSEPDYGSV